MNLLSKQQIPAPGSDDTVFRVSFWGAFFSFLFTLSGWLVGAGLFIRCWLSSNIWGMALSGLYTLMMSGLCRVILRTLSALRSPANWLARAGSGGILLKYRSYLHDDSPGEDPIALHLAWPEIAQVQLQQEMHAANDSDGKGQIRRWFLAIKLDCRYLDVGRVEAALEFETLRRPAHFRVDELQHELFMARKKGAADHEVARIKEEIAREKKLHPGRQSKMKFIHRPVVFIKPDLLKMELTHITPGRKRLQELLAQHSAVLPHQQQDFDLEKPMTEAEFDSLLATLLSREEKIEAVKLVRLRLGLDISAALAYLEKCRQRGTASEASDKRK